MPVRPFPKGMVQKERTAEVVDVTGRGEGGGATQSGGQRGHRTPRSRLGRCAACGPTRDEQDLVQRCGTHLSQGGPRGYGR